MPVHRLGQASAAANQAELALIVYDRTLKRPTWKQGKGVDQD
jgi:hypothetical protein